MGSAIVSPDPLHPSAASLLLAVRSYCSPHLICTIQTTGPRVVFPWPVVHALQLACDTRLRVLVAELQCYGQVLADDDGLTIIAHAP
jgi:hypothetical protein